MKTLLTLSLLGAFGASIVGCSASMDVDPGKSNTSTNTTTSDVSRKTTTVRDANGQVVEKKTELRNNNP